MADSPQMVEHESRLSKVEAEIQSVAHSLGDLVDAVRASEERNRKQNVQTQESIRLLAEKMSSARVVNWPLVVSMITGAFVILTGAAGGILWLATTQATAEATPLAIRIHDHENKFDASDRRYERHTETDGHPTQVKNFHEFKATANTRFDQIETQMHALSVVANLRQQYHDRAIDLTRRELQLEPLDGPSYFPVFGKDASGP